MKEKNIEPNVTNKNYAEVIESMVEHELREITN